MKTVFTEPKKDCFKLFSGYSIKDFEIIDQTSSKEPHEDSIQLIGNSSIDGTRRKDLRAQYSLGILDQVTIENVKISSRDSMRNGIFGSDGLTKSISIRNSSLLTYSPNRIVLPGVIDGGEINIDNVKDFSGKNTIVRLSKARIGGKLDNLDLEYVVMSFHADSSVQFKSIEAIREENKNTYFVDERFKFNTDNCILLFDFRYDEFTEWVDANLAGEESISVYIKELKKACNRFART